MREYVVINVPQDLLPQITGELLHFAADPNFVDVVHEASGRVIHAHPEVADAWYKARTQPEQKVESTPESEVAPEPEPTPVVKAPPPEPAPVPVQAVVVPKPTPPPVVPTAPVSSKKTTPPLSPAGEEPVR